MLEYLRNAADKPVAKFLIGILAFSFVGWGVAEWIFGGAMTDTTLVRVGDAEISVQQYNAEKSRELMQLSREDQRAVYTDPGRSAQFTQTVLTKLTTQQMAENRADDLGFVVTDARIAREIREYPEFQVNGQFSTMLFDSVLMNSGYSEAQFADVLRRQVQRGMVLGPMSAPMAVPEFVVRAVYNARNAARNIEYATVKFSEFDVAAPTDDQLQQYYAQNPHVIPESRAVSYVLISGDLSKPDEYDAAYDNARKVEDDIIAGETFAAAAQAHGAKYVSLNSVGADVNLDDAVMNDMMIARAFEMDEGLESEMIETKQGFVIMRVDKITPAHNAEFDVVKKDLVSDWRRAEQKKQAYVRANELLVDLNQNGKLAGKKSVTVSRTSGAPVNVLNDAFRMDAGANSIVESADAFYVMHVGDEIAPKIDTQKMADVRREMTMTVMRNITDDYNAFLLREYPVEIQEKVYERFIKN